MSDQNQQNNQAEAPAMEESKTPASVGRVLHFYRRTKNGVVGPLCAHVGKVWGPNCVNVKVIASGTDDQPKDAVCTSMIVHEPATEEQRMRQLEGSSWCEWMPYQAGQVKKTEAAEGFLAKRLSELAEKVAALETKSAPVGGPPAPSVPRQTPDTTMGAAAPAPAETAAKPRPMSTNPVTGYKPPAAPVQA